MQSLVTSSVTTLLNSLNEATREVVLKTLIAEKSKEDKTALFESLGYELYGGVKLRDNYHFLILSMCSGGDKFFESFQLRRFYAELDHFYDWRQAPEQILFVANDEDSKFNCTREPLGRNRPTDDQMVYRNDLYEHPEAGVVYDALLKQHPQIFEHGTIMVIRVFEDDLYDDNDKPYSLNTLGNSLTNELHRLYMIRDTLLKTQYCDELDNVSPMTSGVEITFLLNDLKWYGLNISIPCEGGY